ncbi:MAG: hypothetical protein AB1498_11220, partial [bacterium]
MFNLIKNYKKGIILIISISIFSGQTLFSAQEDGSKAIEEFAKKKGRPNPHTEIDCTDCHKTKPGKEDTKETVTFRKP